MSESRNFVRSPENVEGLRRARLASRSVELKKHKRFVRKLGLGASALALVASLGLLLSSHGSYLPAYYGAYASAGAIVFGGAAATSFAYEKVIDGSIEQNQRHSEPL